MSRKYLFITACSLALIGLIGVAVAATPTPVLRYTFVTKWEVAAPNDLVVDSAGNVIVADGGFASRIEKYTPEGALITSWGENGSANGQFYCPQGVAVRGAGQVFVADRMNNRVQRFASRGAFIRMWGSEGSGDGQFTGPWGVAVDTAGNVYVTDCFNHRVQKFTSKGVFITTWGGEGSGDGQFGLPAGDRGGP